MKFLMYDKNDIDKDKIIDPIEEQIDKAIRWFRNPRAHEVNKKDL